MIIFINNKSTKFFQIMLHIKKFIPKKWFRFFLPRGVLRTTSCRPSREWSSVNTCWCTFCCVPYLSYLWLDSSVRKIVKRPKTCLSEFGTGCIFQQSPTALRVVLVAGCCIHDTTLYAVSRRMISAAPVLVTFRRCFKLFVFSEYLLLSMRLTNLQCGDRRLELNAAGYQTNSFFCVRSCHRS